MKNKTPLNPHVLDLRDKEAKNTARALRTEAMKMALAVIKEGENPITSAKKIYEFIEYGSVDSGMIKK